MVESLNNMLVNARKFPYIVLLNVIQAKMSKWWNKRREIGMGLTCPLTPKREDELRPRFAVANGLVIIQLNNVAYHVRGGALNGVVDTLNNTCSCQEFDIQKLPCVHAIVATQKGNFNLYTLVSPYYTKEYYTLAYEDTIYPVSSLSQWNVPDEVAARVVKPREVKERK
ncbi:hypothetical protein UlMin_020918 [Ulmus minor]